MPEKVSGTIKKLFAGQGFGFISPGEHKADVFFHVSNLVDKTIFSRLQLGQAVTYDLEDHQKGPRAVNIQVAATE